MKAAVASNYLYNLIIIFVLIVIAFIFSTISYSIAYRINNRVIVIIERFEGVKASSRVELANALQTIGYNVDLESIDVDGVRDRARCPEASRAVGTNTAQMVIRENESRYCVYRDFLYTYDRNQGWIANESYEVYHVHTYLSFDIPFISGRFKLPFSIKGVTDKIYIFGSRNHQGGVNS